ncbi:MAG: DNA gyrase inhibitor YacG [Vicinamibacterales bacterium]
MPEPTCSYCRRRPVESGWRPFCSERCKLADLGTWLTGGYRVPGKASPEDDPDAPHDDEV